MDNKELFLNHQGQTTPYPLCIEVSKAKGMYITDKTGKSYLDLVAGVSACTLGHCHPRVVKAVQDQAAEFMHVMVYGEFIQKPQLDLATKLASLLPDSLNSTYFVNSGVEAIEASMKLAKRSTGRSEIISCKNSYHGSTQGALSIMGTETYKQKFRPLLPDCNQIIYNDVKSLKNITSKTAAVIIEPVQGATGFITPTNGFLKAVREMCTQVGALLIFDEIQTCYGRTGNLFGFETYGVIPDVLCMAKGMGGGMPIGAFTTSTELMGQLSDNPKLGHITTFGGHPTSCVAALATLNELCETNLIEDVSKKEKLFREVLKHPKIKEVRGVGLMLAIELADAETCQKLVARGIEKGIITFFFLFTDTAVRLSPPLTISEDEIREVGKLICAILDE
ncbi:MAG: aspartate aminotransferase family protein [Flavobacteriales bacterium]|jgi:acetylornithine/N-succinyldiaminopimelate aminotransferase|tara:strand:+ start:3731 stop:4909 length:1179 start_codon:yes stop_codon:yes gene_type:complete